MKGVLAMKGEVFQLFCYFNDNDNKTKGFISLSKNKVLFKSHVTIALSNCIYLGSTHIIKLSLLILKNRCLLGSCHLLSFCELDSSLFCVCEMGSYPVIQVGVQRHDFYCESMWPWALFLWAIVFIIDSISLVVISLFRVSVSS